MSGRDEEGLVSRWSRLKRQPDADAESQTARKAAEMPSPESVGEEEDEAAILERLGLPDPETLQPGDDFSAFMAQNVPAFLKNRALRVLWRSKAEFANLDGLLDYGEDFRAGTRDVVQTMYEVGKGFLKQEAEAEDAPPEQAEDEPEDVDAEIDEPVAEAEQEPIESQVEDDSRSVRRSEGEGTAAQADDSLPAPRRMIFRAEA